jgi:hypothetical protein
MRVAPVAVALSIGTVSVCAQPASEALKGLEACFQNTRAADEICSDPANGATERLDCLQKSRAAQLECLEHIRQGMAAGSAPPKKPAGTVLSEPDFATAPREPPRAAAPYATVAPALPDQAPAPDKPAAAMPPQTPTGPAAPKKPAGTVLSEPGLAIAPRELPGAAAPKTAVAPSLPDRAPAPDKPAAAMPPQTPAAPAPPKTLAKAVDVAPKQLETNWTVSETTSPVDYRPLVTALIRSNVETKGAPDALIIRCRGLRTELLIRTDGTWRATRGSEVEVGYQIDENPFLRLQGALSADGKTATYKNDAADLLRSLPDGARLKINVLDATGPGQETTFHLAGLDAVRKRIAAMCKWTPAPDKLSSGKR